MDEIKKFANDHPIITFLIIDSIISGTLAIIREIKN